MWLKPNKNHNLASTLILTVVALVIVPWPLGLVKDPMVLIYIEALFGLVVIALFKEYIDIPNKKVKIAFGLLLAWATISLLWSKNMYLSLDWAAQLLLVLLLYVLAFQASRIPQLLQRWKSIYIYVAVLFSLFGIWLLYFSHTFTRLSATFNWPNPAALFLVPPILFALDLIIKKRYIYFVPLIILLAAFALTGSRITAILLLIAVFFLVALTIQSKKIKKTVLLASLITVAIIGAFALRYFSNKNYLDQSKININDRIIYVKSTLKVWGQNPLLGVGAGTYSLHYESTQVNVKNKSQSAHNFYLQTLAELGIVGEILLLLTVFYLLKSVIMNIDNNAAIVISLIVFLIHFGLEIDNLYPVLFAILALLAGFGQINPKTIKAQG